MRLLGRPCDLVVNSGRYFSVIGPHTKNNQRDSLFMLRGLQSNAYVYRARVGMHLLAEGFDVMMVDIDAYWLRNPFRTIDAYLDQGADLIGTHGSFPDNIFRLFNTTFCIGFSYYRASPSVAKVWGDVATRMVALRRPDDAIILNHEIFVSGQFQVMQTADPFRGAFHLNSTSENNKTFTLFLIPATIVHRSHCNDSTQFHAVIAHCDAKQALKTTASKISATRGIGLWKVRRD